MSDDDAPSDETAPDVPTALSLTAERRAPRRKKRTREGSGPSAPRSSSEIADGILRDDRVTSTASAPTTPTTPPASLATDLKRELTSPIFLGLFAAVVLAVFAYSRNILGDGMRPYVLVAIGLLAFFFGSASRVHPGRIVAACGSVVAIGLAVVATREASLGPALCLAGGLGLAGGIHRLGRLGPDETPVERDLQNPSA